MAMAMATAVRFLETGGRGAEHGRSSPRLNSPGGRCCDLCREGGPVNGCGRCVAPVFAPTLFERPLRFPDNHACPSVLV